MSNIGYIRVSTSEQNTSRQLENVLLDKVFSEKVSSSKTERPELNACLNYLREGDTLHIHSIDRLARNLIELQSIVKTLTQRGIRVHFHAENMIFSGESSPMQELLFQILGAFAQFERNLIKERQREGIEKAKKEGRYNGRPRKISIDDKNAILKQLSEGIPPSVIAKEYAVSVSSIHKLKKIPQRKENISMQEQTNTTNSLITQSELNDILFEQLEKLSVSNISAADLELEASNTDTLEKFATKTLRKHEKELQKLISKKNKRR